MCTWCRDLYIQALLAKTKTKNRNLIKTTQNKNRYRKIKLLWGCARQVWSSVVVRRPVHRPSPQLCCVVGGLSGLGCGIPLPMPRVLLCSHSLRFYPLVGVSPCGWRCSLFHTHNGDDTLPRFSKVHWSLLDMNTSTCICSLSLQYVYILTMAGSAGFLQYACLNIKSCDQGHVHYCS